MRMYDIVPLVSATLVVVAAIVYDFWIKPKLDKKRLTDLQSQESNPSQN